VPWLYETALHDSSVHAIQHLCFFLTAALFWWTVAQGRYRGGGFGASVLYVFGTATQSGVLGALLVFAQELFYRSNSTETAAWGLTAIEDQQLAGLVMWIPASLIFTLAGLAFLALWLRQSERGRYTAC
jgi:cytochrome c oxidase assembly factor CtaG